MQDIINQLNNIPETAWQLIGASVVLSAGFQVLKKWIGLQSDKVIELLHLVWVAIPMGIVYVTQLHVNDPRVIALQTFLLVGINSPIYRFVIKPTWTALANLVNDAKETRANRLALSTPTTQPAATPAQNTNTANF